MEARFISLLCALIVFCAPLAEGQSIRIGVPQYPRDFNDSSDGASSDTAAMLVRASVGGTLVRDRGEGQLPRFGLELAQALQIAPGSVRVRIGRGLRFSNHRELVEDDVVFSLALCSRYHPDSHLKGVELKEATSDADAGLPPSVDINFALTDVTSMLEFIANCPIVESQSARLFGDDFARGTNYVSAGAYKLKGFSEGRSITLTRSPLFSARAAGPMEIVLVVVPDWERGLSSLRGGDFDALFPPDSATDLIARAAADETLNVSRCTGKTLVSRRGLQLNCHGRLDLSTARYLN